MGCGNSRSATAAVTSTVPQGKPGPASETNNNQAEVQNRKISPHNEDAANAQGTAGKPAADERQGPIGEEAVETFNDPEASPSDAPESSQEPNQVESIDNTANEQTTSENVEANSATDGKPSDEAKHSEEENANPPEEVAAKNSEEDGKPSEGETERPPEEAGKPAENSAGDDEPAQDEIKDGDNAVDNKVSGEPQAEKDESQVEVAPKEAEECENIETGNAEPETSEQANADESKPEEEAETAVETQPEEANKGTEEETAAEPANEQNSEPAAEEPAAEEGSGE